MAAELTFKDGMLVATTCHDCVVLPPDTVALCALHATAEEMRALLLAHPPAHTLPAVHKMVPVVAGCPGCAWESLLARINGETRCAEHDVCCKSCCERGRACHPSCPCACHLEA